MEGFLSIFSIQAGFQSQFLPSKEQKHATLVSVGMSEDVKDPINCLLIDDLYNHRKTRHKFDPPNLLDTPFSHVRHFLQIATYFNVLSSPTY